MPRAHTLHAFIAYFMHMVLPLLLLKLAVILPINTLKFTYLGALRYVEVKYVHVTENGNMEYVKEF